MRSAVPAAAEVMIAASEVRSSGFGESVPDKNLASAAKRIAIRHYSFREALVKKSV